MAIAAGKPRAAAASWFRPSTLLVLALSVADGLSARAWLNGGTSPSPLIIGGGASSQSKLELPLLPTGATPLLPGEALDIQLIGNPAARLLLQYAEDNHQSCCGQLLTRGDPNAAEQELIGVTSLLEIVPYAKGGLPRAARVLYEEGDSVRLQCVGRVRIVGLDQPEGAVLGGGDGGFMVAQVEPYFDEEDGETQQEISAALAASLPLAAELSGEDDDAQQQISEALAASLNGGGGGDATLESSMAEAAAKAVAASAEGAGTSAAEVLAAAQKLLEGLDDEVCTAHAAVAELRGRLWEETAAEPESDLRRDLERMGPERADSLETLIAARRAVLLSPRGGEEAAATRDEEEVVAGLLCDQLSEVWGTAQESAAQRQLLSFAAAAACGGAVRGHALLASSATERLSAALCGLREERRRLTAVVSLRGLAGGRADGPL